jgi:putative endonuclease
MYTVYAIRSKVDGRIYVGFTDNPERRLREHNSGKTKSTKGYVPWESFYTETVPTRVEARNREKYLKSGCGKEFLKKKFLVP